MEKPHLLVYEREKVPGSLYFVNEKAGTANHEQGTAAQLQNCGETAEPRRS